MPFRYLRDPLFVACVLTYFVNRLVLKAVWETGFVHEHLNDLICIPFWVPIMLWGLRRLGLRDSDRPPDAFEIVIPLLVWSWAFEIVLPATSLFAGRCVPDHRDVLYYSLGAFAAGMFWNWWYADPPASDSAAAGLELTRSSGRQVMSSPRSGTTT